ncbi:hypothetical protein ACJ2A9_21175 [Anaerobacillus sp. MEB173]|uniref:hypothetical protein n=1 Tax=Anaerobacillus sp. MEB173 TaxID=3383345 RepID=UPI003F8DF0FC
MDWKDDKELMVLGYALLYDIEINIVHHIVDCFQDYYGGSWRRYIDQEGNFDKATYVGLIRYFVKYPRVFPHIDTHTNKKLYKLKDIRNAICHMKPITDKEFQFLVECYELIKEIISFENACLIRY